MLTVNGTKMSKSLNNAFLPHELFAGSHPLLEQAYSPMTVRFFFLQAHYSSTIDFSNEALQAAEKGYKRLMNAHKSLLQLTHSGNQTAGNNTEDKAVLQLLDECYERMNDDFNTPQTIAVLFELSSKINAYHNKQANLNDLSKDTFDRLITVFTSFITNVLGLLDETTTADNGITEGLMQLVLQMRTDARNRKDWLTSDIIRDRLNDLKITVKDGKDGTTWGVD